MIKGLKLLIGIALLPVCVAAGWTTLEATRLDLLSTPASVPTGVWALLAGLLGWGFLYVCLPRPVRTYVLAHELSHAAWAWAFGARVSNLRVSRHGGSVKVSRSNFLITLAPYFFPLYTVLVVLAYIGLSLATDQSAYRPVWMAAIGFTWSFHLTFTFSALRVIQPDIQKNGRLFSYAVIFLLNLPAPLVWAVCLGQTPWTDVASNFLQHLATVNDWILSGYGRVARRFSLLVLALALPSAALAQEAAAPARGISRLTSTNTPSPLQSRPASPAEAAPPKEEKAAARRISGFAPPRNLRAQDVEPFFASVNRRTRFKRAIRLGQQGEYEDAARELQELLRDVHTPQWQAMLCNNIGAYLRALNRYEEAEYWIRRALKTRPDYLEAQISLSAILLETGRCAQSLEFMEPLTLSVVEDVELQFNLFFNRACAYACLDRPEAALKNLVLAGYADPGKTLANLGDPQLDVLRTHPGFQRLETRLSRGQKAPLSPDR